LSAVHWAIDAHLSLPLINKFLEYFVAEIEGKAQPVDELTWGEETRRLPPALVEAVGEKYRLNPSKSASQVEQPAAPGPVSLPLACLKWAHELTPAIRIYSCAQ
jgi:hypothetical protein